MWTREERERRERERRVIRALEDQRRARWIASGADIRQPPEYRGRVFDTADHDGVHPTPFPPLRDEVGGELTDEFIAFQAHNQTRYATHPEYYCVRCHIRYNARDGGMFCHCIGETETQEQQATSLFGPDAPAPLQPVLPEYPT